MPSTDQYKVNELHEKAMELSEQGFFDRREGNLSEAKSFFKQSYELELQCLNMIPIGTEPTWSAICCGVMWLAHDAGLFQEAIKYSKILIDKTPYAEYKKEAGDLVEALNKLK